MAGQGCQAGGSPQVALQLLGVLHLVVASGCIARPAHNLWAGQAGQVQLVIDRSAGVLKQHLSGCSSNTGLGCVGGQHRSFSSRSTTAHPPEPPRHLWAGRSSCPARRHACGSQCCAPRRGRHGRAPQGGSRLHAWMLKPSRGVSWPASADAHLALFQIKACSLHGRQQGQGGTHASSNAGEAHRPQPRNCPLPKVAHVGLRAETEAPEQQPHPPPAAAAHRHLRIASTAGANILLALT